MYKNNELLGMWLSVSNILLFTTTNASDDLQVETIRGYQCFFCHFFILAYFLHNWWENMLRIFVTSSDSTTTICFKHLSSHKLDRYTRCHPNLPLTHETAPESVQVHDIYNNSIFKATPISETGMISACYLGIDRNLRPLCSLTIIPDRLKEQPSFNNPIFFSHYQ